MNCIFCGKEIEETATFCAHCGKNLKQEDKPNGCLITFLCLLSVFIILTIFGSAIPETPITESVTQQQSSAKYYCHETIKRMLLNPRDAEFASITDVKFNQIENMRWYVNSYVYAINPYGATIKTNFTCKVKLTDDGHGIVEDFTMN